MASTAKDKDKKRTVKGKSSTKAKGAATDDYEDEPAVTAREMGTFTIGIAVALLGLAAVVMLVSYASFLLNGPGGEERNILGRLGQWVVDNLFTATFGVGSLMIPIFLLALVARIFQYGHVRIWKWFINCAFLMIWLSVAGAFLQKFGPCQTFFDAGGMHGVQALAYLEPNIGMVGTSFVLLAFGALYVLYVSGETVRILRRAAAATARRKEMAAMAAAENAETETETEVAVEENAAPLVEQEELAPADPQSALNTATTIEFDQDAPDDAPVPKEIPQLDMEINVGDKTISEGDLQEGERLTIGESEPEAELDDTRSLEPYDPKLDLENYHYPTIDLLKRYAVDSSHVDMDEQRQNKDRIIKVLSSFGVGIASIKATVGPTVTLYEIMPAEGVRIAKIRNLEDDIALSLSALGIRIIAPIPGKGTVGIEVPNAHPQIVSMESVINSKKFQESEMELPMALGKTITNEIFMADLTKMPHLLVAGATGQGKSVGLNAIITSLLYKKHPAELKLVMVDPKKVEFSVYNPIVNHFLAQVEGNEETEEPIITDVNKVIQTLKSLCQEMDTRYDLLKKARVRNVKEYNTKFKERRLSPEKGHKFMPYIVVIIDEFGDLIMTAGKEIETPIARIAQLARAVGIHMIIATQRPTTNIITGTIKANFPARMAFRVGSMVDSRTILDRPGANQLVGKGDMLFQTGVEPVRIQCAFVDTPEVENIASFIACQQSYNAPFPLPMVEMEGDGSSASDVDLNHLDPMFEEVARLVVSTQQGSTSMIQRKFSIGYNRAGRLMDQLEAVGIVGPAQGSKPREVLCMGDIELDQLLMGMR